MMRILQQQGVRISAVGGSLALAVIIAFAPATWETMMVRSFLPQWVAGCAAIALWLLVRRRWRDGALSICSIVLLMPQFGPSTGLRPSGGAPALRIAHLNVLQVNEAYDDVIERILELNADVISVQEVDHEWADALRQGLSANYPHHVIEPRTNCYGIALFSRIALENAHVVMLYAAPAIEAGVSIHEQRATLIAVHTSSPGSPGHFAARNDQLRLLRDRVLASHDPVVVIGDLNATPWDRDLQGFLRTTGLRTNANAAAPTFPSIAHLALIPIDHVLTPPGIGVVAQRTLHVPGSDHRGLVADLALAR